MSGEIDLIVAGSRDIDDRGAVDQAIDGADMVFGPIGRIIHGGARGVDSVADEVAREKGYDVRVVEPDYDRHPSHYAPIERNDRMADFADALVAIWDGESAGTRDMIEKSIDHNLDMMVRIHE